MSRSPCTSLSLRLLSSCSSSTLSSSCSFCSCLRHDLCMPPEFRIQLAAAFCRSIKQRRWKVLVAPAPPPSSAPHPVARGEGPGSGGAAGALLSRAAGWGAGKKEGRGDFRRLYPALATRIHSAAIIQLRFVRCVGAGVRATSSTTAQKLVVPVWSYARWCVLCRFVTVVCLCFFWHSSYRYILFV